MKPKKISIHEVSIDGGTQQRAEINEETVAEYGAAMEAGAKFPPVIVFFDGKTHWLADGFHRYWTCIRIDQTEISAEIHKGTKRDAVLYSVGANAEHGLRRSHEDKRQAILTLLEDEEWSQWSNAEIARRVVVDDKTVAKYRREHDGPLRNSEVKTGDGRTMKTGNIGPKPVPAEAVSFDDPPAEAPAEGWQMASLASMHGLTVLFIEAFGSWVGEKDPTVGSYAGGFDKWTFESHTEGLVKHASKKGIPLSFDACEEAHRIIVAHLGQFGVTLDDGLPSKGADDPAFDHHDQAPAAAESGNPPGLTPQDDDTPVLGKDAIGNEIMEPGVQKAFDLSSDMFQRDQLAIQQVRRSLAEAIKTPLATHINHQQVDADLKNAWNAIKFAAPYALCPECQQRGCKACKDQGWLPKEHYERLTEAKS